MFKSLNFCFMLLIKFMFHVQIIELENRLTQVENEFKLVKEARKKEVMTKKEEEAKRPKETTNDMVARWMKDGV
jgi:hypothetical protein